MKRILCPICLGKGKIVDEGGTNVYKTCHGCGGKGWVEVASVSEVKEEKQVESFECVFLEGQECRVLRVLSKYAEGLWKKEIEMIEQYSTLLPPELQAVIQNLSGSLRTLSAFSPFEVLSKFCQVCPILLGVAWGRIIKREIEQAISEER